MNKLFGLDSHESEGRSLHRMHEMNAYTWGRVRLSTYFISERNEHINIVLH
jgi:hypothetical protein